MFDTNDRISTEATTGSDAITLNTTKALAPSAWLYMNCWCMRYWRLWYVGTCYLCWKRRREVFVSSSGDAAGRKQGVALAMRRLHDDVARLSQGAPAISEITIRPIRAFAEAFNSRRLRKIEDMDDAREPETPRPYPEVGHGDSLTQSGMQHDTHRPIADIVSSPGALHETIKEIIDLAIAENNEEKPLKLRFITPSFVEAWITDENYCDFKITSPEEHEPGMDFVSVSYCWNHTQSMAGLPMLPEYCIQDLASPNSLGRPVSCPTLVFHRAVQFARQHGCPYIWIDQECINQTDPADIEKHLQIMHRVYKESRWTVALLSWTFPFVSAVEVIHDFTDGQDHEVDRTKLIFAILQPLTNDRWFTRTWTHHERLCASSLHYLVPVDPTFTLSEYIKPRMAGNDLHVDASNISATGGYREKFTTSPSEIPAPGNFSSPFAENVSTSMPMRPESEHPWNLVLLQTFDAMDKCDNFLVADRVSILGNICDLPRRLLSNRLNDPKYSYSICLMSLFLANCLPDPAERLNYLQVAWGSTLQHTIRDVFKGWELFEPSMILKAKKKGWDIDDISRRMSGLIDHNKDLPDVTGIEL